MKKLFIPAAALVALLFASCSGVREVRSLEDGFTNPPAEARPMTWWHWMDGNVTKEGIRKDLEWMHASCLSGFFLFDADFMIPSLLYDCVALYNYVAV